MSPSARATGLILLGALAASAPARATSERTFVASYGADSNPCSVAAPCRTFAAALGLTAAGGEVVALDTAGYGSVTITQSVSISAPAGVYAGITPPLNGTGVLIYAPGGTVVLRGLSIGPANRVAGTSPDGVGVNIQAAAAVTVQRCAFNGNLQYGIMTLPAPATQTNPLTLSVSDSSFLESGSSEIALSPLKGATVAASIHNVTMNGIDSFGMIGINAIAVGDGVSATIDNSRIIGYLRGISLVSVNLPPVAGQTTIAVTAQNSEVTGGFQGVYVSNLATGAVVVNVRGNVISGTSGVNSFGFPTNQSGAVYATGGVTMSLDGNTISGNSVGINNGGNSAVIQSYGNNQLEGNASDVVGTLTPAVAQ